MNTDIPTAPEGLIVTSVEGNPFFIYRAVCQVHAACRKLGMVDTAATWEELVLRVYPNFFRHCQEMEQYEDEEPQPSEETQEEESETTTATHTHCIRCARPLRSATSQARGYGRACATKLRTAAIVVDLPDYKPTRIAAAWELIEDGAIIPIRGRRIYRSVSSDGSELYLTAVTGHCNCPAGLRGTRCYHSAAARMLAAA